MHMSACFISKTADCSSVKFGVGDLHQNMPDECSLIFLLSGITHALFGFKLNVIIFSQKQFVIQKIGV